jgi:putative ABC transport system permease protein
MFRLALRTLRYRKGAFAASFVALVLGTIMVMACAGLLETGVRTDVAAQRLADAPIVVTGNQGTGHNEDFPERVRLDSSLVARLAAVPGVTRAVPDVSFPATPLRDGRPLVPGTSGHGWAATSLSADRLVAGSAPRTDSDVVLGATVAKRLPVGSTVTFAIGGGTTTFRVAGILDGPAVDSGVFFTDHETSRFISQPGKIDSVALLTAGTVDLARVAGLAGPSAVVLTGATRGRAEFPDAVQAGDRLIPVASVSGGLTTTVAMFVVAGTLALSLRQRQREMALLRAIGTTPRQLRRMVLGEAGVVSGLAVVIAIVPGLHFGQWVFDQLAHDGVAAPQMQFREGWIAQLSAVGIMVGTALAAAFLAADRAARTRPTEALADAALQRHWLNWFRLLAATLCLGGGLALALVTALVMTPEVALSTAAPSAMLWASGLALLGPGLTRVLIAVFGWPVRAFSGLAGRLAVLNAHSRRIRLAAAVSPIMLLTGLATAMIYLQATQNAASGALFTADLRADAVLVSSTGGMPVDLVRSVAGLPGVGAASAYVPSSVYYQGPPKVHHHGEVTPADPKKYSLAGVSAGGITSTMATDVSSGTLAALTGDTVALPVNVADTVGKHLGDTVTLRLGDGTPVGVRVVALLSPPRGQDLVLMPAELVAAHTTDALVPQILVRDAPGTTPDRLTATLAGFGRQHAGVGVADHATATAAHDASQQTSAWVNYLFVGIITSYAVLALINTLIVATLDRRREFALQRLVGARRGQVIRMMGMESIVVALVGVALGTIVSIATLVPFSLTATRSPLPSGPVAIYLVVVAGAALLAVAATVLPTMAALPRRPSTVVAE